MSREFGEWTSGYFHDKIRTAKEDLEQASYPIHKELIPLFELLYKIAYQISNVEAADSCEYASIEALEQNVPDMIKELKRVQKIVKNSNRMGR